MGFIEKNLMKDEKLIYLEKLHWIIFMWPLIFLVIAVISSCNDNNNSGFVGTFLFLTTISGIMSAIKYFTSEFGITNKRVVAKYGLVHRKTIDILLVKVEGVWVIQGAFGRLLKYGSLVLGGTGGSKGLFKKISNPFRFKEMVETQIGIVQR